MPGDADGEDDEFQLLAWQASSATNNSRFPVTQWFLDTMHRHDTTRPGFVAIPRRCVQSSGQRLCDHQQAKK